ncbi:hypothetical protein [Pseudoxanthomonas sp. X-1]|uniref:hypothetical protein n=1 Tax=Pseudoxanthomonas sp. X-1 TaxID=2571115 RepID=UPI00110A4D66|nr:hypothetical protein [Pseudoxanthomonas sp. X-1]TMN25790.1 hypothetical protein FF950_00540 [Pseudoxanthomonas sp. X-1]UAY72951.1 hypothetical protein LAJ50_10470 [Pseudoxanthomonas sp. X-1]
MISGTACPQPRLDARMRRSTRIGLDVHSTPSYPGKTGGHRMKYGIVRQIANLAFQLDDNPEHVYRWITDEHVPALGDRRPIELIWEDQGELVLSFLSDLIGRNAPSTASPGGCDHSKRVSSPDIPQTQRAPSLA